MDAYRATSHDSNEQDARRITRLPAIYLPGVMLGKPRLRKC